MAIYFAGYLSPIRNKLGNAVGRKWRTIDVLSAYNGRPRNPRTTAQQINRTIFGAAASIARDFDYALKIGFKTQCDGTSIPERSMFIKKNYNTFKCDTPGACTVDYSALVLAEGTLPAAGFGNARFTNPLAVDVTMTDSSALPGALETDKIVLFVYSPEAGAGMPSAIKLRDDDEISVTVPTQWNGHRVHVWGLTYGAPNADNAGKVSNSVYLGSGTIQ